MELNDEEKAKLVACLNPDDPQAAQYDFGVDIEQSIIATMLADLPFLVQCFDLCKPKYFVGEAREVICDVLFEYFGEKRAKPEIRHLELLVRQKVEGRRKPAAFFIAELNLLADLVEYNPAHREFLLEQVEEFARHQAMRHAYVRTLDLMFRKDKDKWPKIWEILKEPQLISRHKDLGLDYFGTIRDRYARWYPKGENPRDLFTTGFDGEGYSIDSTLGEGGCGRGELYGFIASAGVGKSLALATASVKNVARGHKVLFLSLEMDADKVSRRFDAQFANHNIALLKAEEARVIPAVLDNVRDFDDKRRLVVKQFAPGTADVNTFRSFHAKLGLAGFVPDLVVVDYIGEMKDYPGVKTYESRYRLCRDLRAWGIEANHCTFTAIQPNRGAKAAQEEQGVIREEHIADSFDQIRVFDGLWSISQSKAEKTMHMARIHNIKLRDGKSGDTFPAQQDMATLQFQIVCEEHYKGIMQNYREEKEAEVKVPKKDGRFRRNGGAGEDDR